MKNVKDILSQAFEQLDEDRKTLKLALENYSGMTSAQDLAMNGANMNKCLELLSKQTSQLLELAKLQSSLKRGADDDHISSKDAEGVYNMISKEVTKIDHTTPRRKNGNQ